MVGRCRCAADEPEGDRRRLHPRRTRRGGRARPLAPHLPQVAGRLDCHQRCEARGCARAATSPSGTAAATVAPPLAARLTVNGELAARAGSTGRPGSPSGGFAGIPGARQGLSETSFSQPLALESCHVAIWRKHDTLPVAHRRDRKAECPGGSRGTTCPARLDSPGAVAAADRPAGGRRPRSSRRRLYRPTMVPAIARFARTADSPRSAPGGERPPGSFAARAVQACQRSERLTSALRSAEGRVAAR